VEGSRPAAPGLMTSCWADRSNAVPQPNLSASVFNAQWPRGVGPDGSHARTCFAAVASLAVAPRPSGSPWELGRGGRRGLSSAGCVIGLSGVPLLRRTLSFSTRGATHQYRLVAARFVILAGLGLVASDKKPRETRAVEARPAAEGWTGGRRVSCMDAAGYLHGRGGLAAWAWAGHPFCCGGHPGLASGLRLREYCEKLTDRPLMADRLAQRHIALDAVVGAPAVLVFDDVSRFGQVVNDADHGALADADDSSDLTQAHTRVAGDAHQDAGVSREKCPFPHMINYIEVY
jgi:hypothetical protein